MIEIILEEDEKAVMATNISLERLYRAYERSKKGDGLYLKGHPQNDNASLNAKKGLPELCFSRSEYLPQKNGVIPSQYLRTGQLIKIVLNMNNVLKLRGVKKPYPVSYGNANKKKALNTEMRGEERIQIDKLPIDKKYMTIYIPDNLFEKCIEKINNYLSVDRNANISTFMKGKDDFRKWIEEKKKEGLIKLYKDTSRKAKYFNY